MRILVFGKNGQVARSLAPRLQHHDVVFQSSADTDLAVTGAATRAIETHAPSIVINAAAYTKVDLAEEETSLCRALNTDAPTEMAIAARRANAQFVHLSTDYVFDGDATTPYTETAATNPASVYGQTKRDGEIGVLAEYRDAVIMRTSWVFSEFGGNFVKTMLRLSQERDSLSIVDDQIGGPTSAHDIAAAISAIAVHRDDARGHGGIYHYQGAPAVSWADFAREIFQMAARSAAVTGIPTADYPTPATRPLRTVLDCQKITDTFGVSPPDWKQSLRYVLDKLENGAK